MLARGVEGYHRLAGAITEAQLRGDEKGRPLYDLDELAEPAGRALDDPDRLPQGGGTSGLVPYVGPLVATIVVTGVALTVGTVPALIALGLLLAYHVVEGHTLRPFLYGRAVKLSPLAVLVAIILGTDVAGILGALVAIPVAGSIQVIIRELLQRHEKQRRSVLMG